MAAPSTSSSGCALPSTSIRIRRELDSLTRQITAIYTEQDVAACKAHISRIKEQFQTYRAEIAKMQGADRDSSAQIYRNLHTRLQRQTERLYNRTNERLQNYEQVEQDIGYSHEMQLLQLDSTENAIRSLIYAKETADDIRKLEEGIADIHQTFVDVATLSDIQGAELPAIQSNLAASTANTAQSVQVLEVAASHRLSSRKKKLLIACLILASVAIVVVSAVVVVAAIAGVAAMFG